MDSLNGNAIYNELDGKIKSGCELTDADMLNLIFVPLMRNSIPAENLAANSIKLSQTIPDKTKRNACIAAVFAFANRYLEESKLNELLEVLKMTDLVTMLVEDAVNDASQAKALEIAKNALRKGATIEFIAEITDLDETTVERLQAELDNKQSKE